MITDKEILVRLETSRGRIIWQYQTPVTDTATVVSPCDYATSKGMEEAYQLGKEVKGIEQEVEL